MNLTLVTVTEATAELATSSIVGRHSKARIDVVPNKGRNWGRFMRLVHTGLFSGCDDITDHQKFSNAGAIPGWDNSSRRDANGYMFFRANPALYQGSLMEEFDSHAAQLPEEYLIKAWNELAQETTREPSLQIVGSCAAAIRDDVELHSRKIRGNSR